MALAPSGGSRVPDPGSLPSPSLDRRPRPADRLVVPVDRTVVVYAPGAEPLGGGDEVAQASDVLAAAELARQAVDPVAHLAEADASHPR